MEYRTLGRTDLQVSVMALGCGGPSRIGQNTGHSNDDSVAIIRAALDAGVNFIDTATAYRTEPLVAEALAGRQRDQLVISSKLSVKNRETDQLRTPAELAAGIEASLRRLGTDYIDIYHLHGVLPDEYPHARELAAELQRQRELGKIRFPGITENFTTDTEHRTLQLALADDLWDVVMVGFNMLNHSARQLVFPATQAAGVGTMVMFAVRRAFSKPERLRELLRELAERKEVAAELATAEQPLAFLTGAGAGGEQPATGLADAAYRYCKFEPGVDSVLSGTGNLDHLRANLRSLQSGRLPAAAHGEVTELFQRVVSVSGG